MSLIHQAKTEMLFMKAAYGNDVYSSCQLQIMLLLHHAKTEMLFINDAKKRVLLTHHANDK